MVIRGALWGMAAGVFVVLMLELLALITTGPGALGTFVVLGGPGALGAGAIAGVLTALSAWGYSRRNTDDDEQKTVFARFSGGAAFVLSVVGLNVIAIWFTMVSGSHVQWWLLIALIVLGVGVPVAGLAVFAAGKVHEAMALRFPRD